MSMLEQGCDSTRSRLFSLLLFGVFIIGLSRPLPSNAQKTSNVQGTLKAFVLTSTYGVLAGALTGLASLAFYENASPHTRNIALGASIGLYTGILLGAYVVYGPSLSSPSPSGPSQPEERENPEDPINLGADIGPRMAPTLSYLPAQGVQVGVIYRF